AEMLQKLLVLDHILRLAAWTEIAEFRSLTLPGPEYAHGLSDGCIVGEIEDARAALLRLAHALFAGDTHALSLHDDGAMGTYHDLHRLLLVVETMSRRGPVLLGLGIGGLIMTPSLLWCRVRRVPPYAPRRRWSPAPQSPRLPRGLPPGQSLRPRS